MNKIFIIVFLVLFTLNIAIYSQPLSPINGARVIVTGDNGYANVLTGLDGKFEINEGLGPGKYQVIIGAEGYIDKVIRDVIIEANKIKDLGDITLEVSGRIDGKVVDINGNPISNILLELRRGETSILTSRTGSDGSFTLQRNIDTGTYTIIVYPASMSSIEFKMINLGLISMPIPVIRNGSSFAQGYTTTIKTGIKATKGKTTSGVIIQLRPSGIISGRVTDKQGNPIKDVMVFAYKVGTSGEQSRQFNGFWALTDNNGFYQINTNLATGIYNVTVFQPKGYVWNYMNAKKVSVKEGQETKNVDFQLEKSGIISGVVKWQDGKLAPGAFVFAVSETGKYFGWALADENGNFRIESGLATGNYMVIALKGNAFSQMPVQVKVTAGEETKGIVVTIQGNPRFEVFIEGKVTDNKGKALSGVIVSSGDTSVTTDSQGRYKLKTTIIQSPVKLSVTASKKGYKSLTREITAEAGKTYTLDFQLEPQPWGILKGRVLGVSTAKKKAQLSIFLSTNTISLGDSVIISGQLSPIREGKITLYYSYNNETFTKLAEITLSNGRYSYSFKPTKEGIYRFKAEWPGDNQYDRAVSQVITLETQKITPQVSITLSKSSAKVGETITVSGTISPFKGSTKIIIQISSPSGVKQYQITSTDGKFSYSFKVDMKGIWKVKAIVPIGTIYNEASSTELTVNVSEAPQQKKCIIATVTFGSEVSPEVNFLRNFRNNLILQTFSGRRFYVAFDAFYYSWSTSVALYIESHPYLKNIVKPILYPLLGVLKITALIVMPWFTLQPEIATVTAGILASSLLGLVYLFPIELTVHILRARYGKSKPIPRNLIKINSYISILSLILLIIGVFILNPWLTTITSSSLVLSNIVLAGTLPLYFLEKRKVVK